MRLARGGIVDAGHARTRLAESVSVNRNLGMESWAARAAAPASTVR